MGKRMRAIKHTGKNYWNYRKGAKERLREQGMLGKLLLTKKGAEELNYAYLYLHQGEIEGLMRLRQKHKSRTLGGTNIGTLDFWLTKIPKEEREKFKKAHPNPKKESKDLGI